MESAPNFRSLNRYNSATNSSISLTFGTEPIHYNGQTVRVEGRKV